MNRLLSFLALLLMSHFFISCSDKVKELIEEKEDETSYHIKFETNRHTFEYTGGTQTFTVDTNVEDIECIVEPSDFCHAEYSEGELTISCPPSTELSAISGKVILKGEDATATISITLQGVPLDESIKDDIKIPVKSGETSSFQNGSGIDLSFDGDLGTIYHSNWSNGGENYFPITLTYNFEDAEAIDYLIYNPRQSGYNGHFKEVEIWASTKEKPALTKYKDHDFKGSSVASRVTFDKPLVNPTQIKFVIKSGHGDGQGFAACAEMEFFRKNPDNFDYLSIFTDHTCSELKSDITEDNIKAVGNPFFRDLAMRIYKGEYADSEFRIQEYKSWQHPDIMANANKTGTYGLRDNPTGIYANSGEEIIVFVGETGKEAPSLLIQDVDGKFSGVSYALSTGINKITATKTGLIYIMYYTDEGKEAPVKIHFATGNINGYFDSQKHTKDDWNKLLNKATFKHFDVIGEYAILTFETNAFKTYTRDGLALINAYDDMVYLQQDFMGLNKYDCAYKNRAYFLVIYESYMYASSYHTAYNASTQSEILDVNRFKTNAVWGPAHEIGHTHQTRPGLKWTGTTEVTNNIHSLYVQTQFGNTSRLIQENRYGNAKKEIIDKKLAHNACEDVFLKLVPFWQLKLYLQDALGKADFYKDVYQQVRINPNPATEGQCQIEFIKIACDAAQLDLTEFFEQWGFFTPIDIEIDDYGKAKFTVTQAMIDDCKAYIASKEYEKPKHNNIYEITDENVNNFK